MLKAYTVPIPLGGVNKRFALDNQPPASTPRAKNVFPYDQAEGRARIATRPQVSDVGSVVGVPYNWCEVSYVDSGTKFGAAVTTSNGTAVSLDGNTWTNHITTAPGTDFASCECYQQVLFQARGGGTCKFLALDASPGAGADLTAGFYDPPTDSEPMGTAPENCGIVCAHGDRLYLAGDTLNPHVLYASGIGDYTNWDFASSSEGHGWASSGAEGGSLQEPITGLISHTRDCLLIGHTDAVTVLRGDPRAGGQMEVISHYVGPLMHSAWCHDATGRLWCMTRDGLYTMQAGCGDFLEFVSRKKLPQDLVGLDPGSNHKVSLSYDRERQGLLICVNATEDQHWFFDITGGGMWPLEFAATFNLAFPMKRLGASPFRLFNSSGDVYKYSDDPGGGDESFAAEIWYGPIKLGGPGAEGVLHGIQATLADVGNHTVEWEIYTGNSPEEAFNSSAAFTGADWTVGGLNHWQHPRARGTAAYIRVFTESSTARWGIENIDVKLGQLGLRRV